MIEFNETINRFANAIRRRLRSDWDIVIALTGALKCVLYTDYFYPQKIFV